MDIDSFRWGLFARGEYRSRKVLFFLFRGSDTAPALVVKMTRHPSLNARLENEGRALALLQSRGIGERGTLPEVAFFGHHGGLAILGQTAIDGIPLRHRTALTADCACARAGAALLTDLGAATAERNAATPEEVTVALGALCEQFERIYDPAPRYRAALRDQLAAIAASPAPLPLVFQHGDPGIWNALVTPAGRIAFLDWEAAEPQGLPLWDLFYYLHSYCIAAARARGIRGRLNGFSSQFLRESDLSPLIVEAIEGYCARLGVPRRLVEPLLLTCWMHRALKEANRLPATKLASGHFFGVLKRCIDERDSPILARLAARHSGSVPLREPAPAAQGSAADA